MAKQQSLGGKLRALRTDSHLSQKDLAGYIGVSSRQIRRYESGKALPGPRAIRACCKLFGVNSIDLLDDRFEFGSKQLFQKLKPYVEAHLSDMSKKIYATGQCILKLKMQDSLWARNRIEALESEYEDLLRYFSKATSDWEQAHFM